MKTYYSIIISCLTSIFIFSCKDMDKMNINPNGVDPSIADPSLVISTVITKSGTETLGLGWGDLAGVVQHTQKDGWQGGHNQYDWNNQNWGGYYDNLRNAKELLRKAGEKENDFYAGVAKLFLAYNFGAITDLWGDAPFWGNAPVSEALQGKEGIKKPKYDLQRDIYMGILEYLEEANILLSKNQSEYVVNVVQDVLYGGNVAKWRKFANSLALRYYLRISEKEPAIAEAGIKKILGDPAMYPLVLDVADDATFEYPGGGHYWPSNTVYDLSETGNWYRLKMCSTLVEKLRELEDPRIAVWANRVEIPFVFDPDDPDRDEVVDGKRYVGENVEQEYNKNSKSVDNPDGDWFCYNQDYVGLPPAVTSAYAYQDNPNKQGGQGIYNPHVSNTSDLYRKATDPMLKVRMLSAAEIHFSLAEIALKGWGGNAGEQYDAGIRASFETWGVSSSYDEYIAHAGVAFNGTLEQIMEQKWIASWTAATEAWFDYRRTGLPAFQPGQSVKVKALPLRFYYGDNELNYNGNNVKEAIERLEETRYNLTEEGKNSAWSKMWLMQGSNKPW